MSLKIKLAPGAKVPYKGSILAAGYDLYSNCEAIIPPSSRLLISTGLFMEIPQGCYGRIAPRSGLAVKHSIDIGAGVIDADYRGEVKILLINSDTKNDFKVEKHQRIAQLVLEKYCSPEIVVVQDVENTKRGEGGFGSSGDK